MKKKTERKNSQHRNLLGDHRNRYAINLILFFVYLQTKLHYNKYHENKNNKNNGKKNEILFTIVQYEHNGICLCTCVVYVWYGFMLWFVHISIDLDGNYRIDLRSFDLGDCECVVSVSNLKLFFLLLFFFVLDRKGTSMTVFKCISMCVCVCVFVLFFFLDMCFFV